MSESHTPQPIDTSGRDGFTFAGAAYTHVADLCHGEKTRYEKKMILLQRCGGGYNSLFTPSSNVPAASESDVTPTPGTGAASVGFSSTESSVCLPRSVSAMVSAASSGYEKDTWLGPRHSRIGGSGREGRVGQQAAPRRPPPLWEEMLQ